jgi:hypothetical protein
MTADFVPNKEFAMNQFFYETRGKEKVQEIMKEGLIGQELRRSGTSHYEFFRGLPKLIVITALVLGALGLIFH